MMKWGGLCCEHQHAVYSHSIAHPIIPGSARRSNHTRRQTLGADDGRAFGTNTLAFGHAQLARAVVKRIQRHFRTDATRRSVVEQSLVVGVFGEWGSGKSSLLHAVKQDFDAQPDEAAPVVTVFFNAWRYEKEPHLIVPLLKVVEAAIKRKAAESSQDASSPVWTRLKGTLVKGIKLFRSAALAFASTYEGTVTFKPPGEKEYALKISPKDAIEIFYASQDRNTPSSETPDLAHYAKLDEYDTLYLEFERQLRELTEGEPALNLLFFIDDLDRCLPEKALEMLEAIKLFFRRATLRVCAGGGRRSGGARRAAPLP